MDEQPEKCNNCGYETEALEYYDYENKWLCSVCSETYFSKADECSMEMQILYKSIAYLGNMILDEIRKNNSTTKVIDLKYYKITDKEGNIVEMRNSEERFDNIKKENITEVSKEEYEEFMWKKFEQYG